MSEPSDNLKNRRLFLLQSTRWMAGLGLLPLLPIQTSAAPERGIVTGEPVLQTALLAALQGHNWNPSSQIDVEVPDIAENGAMIPVSAESHLPNTEQLLIFAERNPTPLSARFDFMPGAIPWVSLRIRMNETGALLVIAKTAQGYFGTRRQVRVMLGGCG